MNIACKEHLKLEQKKNHHTENKNRKSVLQMVIFFSFGLTLSQLSLTLN